MAARFIDNTEKQMMNACFLALEALFIRYTNLYKEQPNSLPYVEFDSPWPSPCSVLTDTNSTNETTVTYWKPVSRKQFDLFNDLEKALEITFHEDIKTFYGSFWSNGICVERNDINFNLIQIWNEEDQEQLKENILGHAFAKIKAKLPLTFFIGCTFGDEVVSLDQESGQIVLEKPGRKAHKVLAPSLESFLLTLTPTSDTYT